MANNDNFISIIIHASRQYYLYADKKNTTASTNTFIKVLEKNGLRFVFEPSQELEMSANGLLISNGLSKAAENIAYGLFIYCLFNEGNENNLYGKIYAELTAAKNSALIIYGESNQEAFFSRLYVAFGRAINQNCAAINFIKAWELCDNLFAHFEDPLSYKILLFSNFNADKKVLYSNEKHWLTTLIVDQNYDAAKFEMLLNSLPLDLFKAFFNNGMHATLAAKMAEELENNAPIFSGDTIIDPYIKFTMAINKIVDASGNEKMTVNLQLPEKVESYYKHFSELETYSEAPSSQSNAVSNSQPANTADYIPYLKVFESARNGILFTRQNSAASTSNTLTLSRLPFIRKEEHLNIKYWQPITTEVVTEYFRTIVMEFVLGSSNLTDFHEHDKSSNKNKTILHGLAQKSPGPLNKEYIQLIKKHIENSYNGMLPQNFSFYCNPHKMIDRFIILQKNILYLLRAFDLSQIESMLYVMPSLKNMIITMALFATQEQKESLKKLSLFGNSIQKISNDFTDPYYININQINAFVTKVQDQADRYLSRFSFNKQVDTSNLCYLIQNTKKDTPATLAACKIILALMDYGKEDFLDGSVTAFIGESTYSDLQKHKPFFIAQINISLRKINSHDKHKLQAKLRYEYLASFMSVLNIKDAELDENAKSIAKLYNSSAAAIHNATSSLQDELPSTKTSKVSFSNIVRKY